VNNVPSSGSEYISVMFLMKMLPMKMLLMKKLPVKMLSV